MFTPRTDHLGAAVRQARQRATTARGQTPQAPMTTADLAARLPRHRGLRAQFPVLQDCARALDDIERGCAWPFAPGDEQVFILDCARALSLGNRTTRRDLKYELTNAAAHDLAPPLFP